MNTYKVSASSDLGLPSNTYIYSFATTAAQDDVRTDIYRPLSSSDRLAVISSDDSLRLFDPATIKILPDGLFASVNKSVTCLKRFASNGQACNILLTAGRDGSVCGWDQRLRSQIHKLRSPKSQPLSMIDGNADSHVIVAGTELEGNGPGNVDIFGWDIRNPGTVMMKYSESHTDTITTLRFIPHAKSSSLLLSASTDGLINIFDTAITEEEDAIVQVINHRSALHHAGIIGNDLYGLGTDETLSLYPFSSQNLEEEEPPPIHLGDIRESFDCEYAINITHSGSAPILSTGNHTEQWLDLVPLRLKMDLALQPGKYEANFSHRSRLMAGHGEELVRDVYLSSGTDIVFTCGEDGVVNRWTSNQDSEDVEMTYADTPKKRRHDGGGRKRKRPKSGYD